MIPLRILLCFCPLHLFAQSTLPPPFSIDRDSLPYQKLEKGYWQMLEDTTSGKWNIDVVSGQGVSNAFHESNGDTKNAPYPVNTYWIRFRLKNSLGHDANIVLQQQSSYADFYVFGSDGKWTHFANGVNKPWSKRDGFKHITAVAFTIPPATEATIYERIEFDRRAERPGIVAVGFGSSEKMIAESYVDNDHFLFNTILGSFFIGLLFFAAIFNFFFFLVVHERVYLYYALCLLTGTINEYHDIFYHVFFREHPWLVYTNVILFLVLVNFFATQMERYFLNTFSHYPRWDKILQISVLLQLLAVLAVYFIGPHLPNNVDAMLWTALDGTQGIVLVCILTTFLLFIRKKDKSARRFVIACLPVATVWVANYIIINVVKGAFADSWSKYYQRVELLCVSSLVIILSWILFDRYNLLRKENAERALLNERLAKEKEIERSQLIAQQKVVLEHEVAERTAELKQSLEDLKAAQKQLIQSEKMASLGELTAGIAHEIQNPLNFVNNFSEVSEELLDELKDGPLTSLDGEYKTEAKEVMNVLTENLHKINYHGKRADAIVKAMLDHTTSRKGSKEPVDINLVTEKYLRVSYSGARAKDKNLRVKLVTSFDGAIGKVEVIQRDLGRVLVNLFSNAFYSLAERSKLQQNSYEPSIVVRTQKLDDEVLISVRDNGAGIRQEIIDKIFQPFFTTKPTGQGTGLGLSLSYDIIKANGGDLKVETIEGEYAEFTIVLPLK